MPKPAMVSDGKQSVLVVQDEAGIYTRQDPESSSEFRAIQTCDGIQMVWNVDSTFYLIYPDLKFGIDEA
jgi:hypothetical protein